MALVIPDVNLSVESIAALGEGEIMPAGVMFLHRLAPLVVERALAERRQRVLTVSEGGQQAAISMWPLAVGKVGGQPVLLVYASGASPAIVTTLVMTDAASSHNVTLTAERAGDQRAAFVITVAGSYRAAIPVTGQRVAAPSRSQCRVDATGSGGVRAAAEAHGRHSSQGFDACPLA